MVADIAFVELGKDIPFVNQTFENTSGVTPRFSRLLGEYPEDDLKRLQVHGVYLNSPFTGDMEGTVVGMSARLTSCSKDAEPSFVLYNWAYTGQVEGANRPMIHDGTCGSAIWDDDGVIVGFFHYYIAAGPWAGFAVSVSADEAVKAGYKLATPSNASFDSSY